MPIEIDLTKNAFFQDYVEAGVSRGLSQGRSQGLSEGGARMFLRILEQRFGAVPLSIREQVGTAGIEDLERWADRLATATRIEEVFS